MAELDRKVKRGNLFKSTRAERFGGIEKNSEFVQHSPLSAPWLHCYLTSPLSRWFVLISGTWHVAKKVHTR